MNLERFELPTLELDLSQLREVYRCVLHTILFNRAVGWVKPRETPCEAFQPSLFYACIDDPSITRTVNQNVDQLYSLIERQAILRTRPTITTTIITPNAPPSSTSSPPPPPLPPIPASFSLSFYENAPSKSWFGPASTKLYWERWILPCSVNTQRGGGEREGQEERFRLVMTSIVTLVNEKRDHLPTVKAGKEGLTYSFECESECRGVEGGGGGEGMGGGEDGGWGLTSMMKKVFKEGPPMLIPK